LSKTPQTKRHPVALTTAALTLAVSACSANTATPPPSTLAITTTVTSPSTTTSTSTTSTTSTTLDPKTIAAAAARTSWETFRANIEVCRRAYPDCDVETLLVPYLTNPYKDVLIESYAKSQSEAKISGAIWVDIESNSDVFEDIDFVNSELSEAVLTSCGVYRARKIIPATPTTPEIVVDDEQTVIRIRTIIVLEVDEVWRVKGTASDPVEFEGVETCPPEN
jgi:hypothetical protein